MKLLKKQPVAILIALIVVAGALVFGVNRSVGAEVEAVRAQFYSGVFDPQAGFTRTGIHGQLTQRSTAALRMLSIGEFSHPDSEELAEVELQLRTAQGALISALTHGMGPSALFSIDQALELAAERYFAVLHPLVVEAEGEDLAALEAAYGTMQGAARVIRESGYNEAVRTFHRTVMGQFPMNVLRPIVFQQMPELFA